MDRFEDYDLFPVVDADIFPDSSFASSPDEILDLVSNSSEKEVVASKEKVSSQTMAEKQENANAKNRSSSDKKASAANTTKKASAAVFPKDASNQKTRVYISDVHQKPQNKPVMGEKKEQITFWIFMFLLVGFGAWFIALPIILYKFGVFSGKRKK